MEMIEDICQQSKIRYSLKDILVIVLFATLANADTWGEIEDFARNNEDYLTDGKTMRSSKQGKMKPNHIVSVWNREDGYCLGLKQ